MAVTFPTSPSTNQVFSDSAGTWTWTGFVWDSIFVGPDKWTTVSFGTAATPAGKIIASGGPSQVATKGPNNLTGHQYHQNNDIRTIRTATFAGEGLIATTSGTITIDWALYQNYKQTEPTGTITYLFLPPPGPCHLQLRIDSDGTSTAQTIVLPSGVTQYNQVFATATNKKSIISFWYDGQGKYDFLGSNEV